jgi:hypothetical protein
MDLIDNVYQPNEDRIALYDKNNDPHRRESSSFVKGMIVGFGLAAVASVLFNLFQEQRANRRREFSAESRIRKQDENGGVLGDLSYIVDESTSAFNDAVRTLDRTFESGRKAIESVADVINKIRE